MAWVRCCSGAVVLATLTAFCWGEAVPGEGAASGARDIEALFDTLAALMKANNDTLWPKGKIADPVPKALKALRQATAEKFLKGKAHYRFEIRHSHVQINEWLSRHQPQSSEIRLALNEYVTNKLGMYTNKWQWVGAYHDSIATRGAPYFSREATRERWPELAEAMDELEKEVVPVLVAEYDQAIAGNPALAVESNARLHLEGHWKLIQLVGRPRKPLGCKQKGFPGSCAALQRFDTKIRKGGRGQLVEARCGTLHPGTKVALHTAVSNQRLDVHCGIHNPDNVQLHIADMQITWKQGECILIDGSFEHKFETTKEQRPFTILELNLEHPDLMSSGYLIDDSRGQRRKLTAEMLADNDKQDEL